MWHIKTGAFGEISLQLKVVNNFENRLHFKIYYGVLNLPRVLFQIHILLEVLLLVYFITVASVVKIKLFFYRLILL